MEGGGAAKIARRISRQLGKHVKLYSGLLQTYHRNPMVHTIWFVCVVLVFFIVVVFVLMSSFLLLLLLFDFLLSCGFFLSPSVSLNPDITLCG